MKSLTYILFASFMLPLAALSEIVINELHYNPPDYDLEAGELREFVELYNPDGVRIDLSGCYFDNGITYTFPEGTWIEAGSYIVVAKSLSPTYWRNVSFRIVGPYDGVLADGGERITLKWADGSEMESFRYSDDPPWPLGADGYERSLERISWDLPADDPHSWRSSEEIDGTPGRENSVVDVPPYPAIREYSISPEHPTSADDVQVRVVLDGAQNVESATLRFETSNDRAASSILIDRTARWRYWKGTSSPSEGTDWASPEYDHSGWDSGRGGFGYGDTDRVNTVLSDMRGNYSTLYLRGTIVIDDPDAVGNLFLYIYYDDGFICYINGEEVARENAPSAYTHESIAESGHEGDSQSVYPLQVARQLHEGQNTIALVGFNISRDSSSDFVLAPALVSEKSGVSSENQIPMTVADESGDSVTYTATIPRVNSQNLVRSNLSVRLTNGSNLILPHAVEPNPFLSYFVYDGEVESTLPVLWIVHPRSSMLIDAPREIGAAVCLPVGASHPDVFDGVFVIPSASSRVKLRFVKGNEFYGDRTINIIPEIPTGGTNAGVSSPYREHLGFWFFAEMGVPSPWSEFYRTIEFIEGQSERHTQRLINQQINERFLEMNGRDPDADLYKLVYSYPNWEKHTNKLEGTGSIEELLAALNTRDEGQRRAAMEERLDLDEFMAYSVASLYTSNWDGYWNNNWMYLDPDSQKWEIYPWDLDWIWGATPPPNTGPMYWRMPLDFPIDGVADGDHNVSRAPGPVTSPMHQDPAFYEDYLLAVRRNFNGAFAQEHLFAKMDETQERLFADLDLLEQQIGRNASSRKTQIQDSYDTLKLYVERRRAYLDPLLPVPVADWSLY